MGVDVAGDDTERELRQRIKVLETELRRRADPWDVVLRDLYAMREQIATVIRLLEGLEAERSRPVKSGNG